MVSTRKKKQSNRRLLSQLDDFDQDMIIGNTASERQENIVVNEGTNDRDSTVGTSSNNITINESAMSVKSWRGVSMKELIEKRAILLIQLMIGYRMQF